MALDGVCRCLGDAVALFREDVQENRFAWDSLDRRKRRLEFVDVVAVNRPVVLEAELLPEACGHQEVTHAGFDTLRALPHLATEGEMFDEFAHIALGRPVEGVDAQLVHVPAQRATFREIDMGVVVRRRSASACPCGQRGYIASRAMPAVIAAITNDGVE